MQNYINFLDKFKYQIIIITTLIVALLSTSLSKLAFEGSYRIWFDKDSSIIKNYDKFREEFSNDDTFFIAFSDTKNKNGIFNKKAIQTIMDLTSEFEELEMIEDVSSLTNYNYMSGSEDNFEINEFIDDYEDNKYLAQKRDIALKDNLILNQLISQDGKTTAIALRLSDENIENNSSIEQTNIYLYKKILDILKKYELKTGYKFYLSGNPAITASLVLVASKDAKILMPLAVIVVVVLLFVFFRSFIGVLIPSIVIVFTFLSVLSLQMILGYKLNNFTVNIPSFVSAIAIADAMHLYLAWVYYKFDKNYTTNKEALRLALSHNLLPMALTSLTTALGFVSLGFSNIEPISTLGIAITTSAILAFVFSITIAPAILLTLKDDYKVNKPKLINIFDIKGYGKFITKYDKLIVLSFLVLFIILGYGLKYTKIDSNSIKYFAKDTIVRSGSDFIQNNLTGAMIYEIIINTHKKDGIKDAEFLKKVDEFEKELHKKFKNIRFATSIKDILVRMQKVLNPNSKENIPASKNLIAQYLLLYDMNLPSDKNTNDKIDANYQKIRITINSDIQDTSKDLAMIDWINKWWSKTKYFSEVQGQTTIFAYMQDSVSDTLMVSIGFTLFSVVVLMFIIFRNLKMTLLFILPNIMPIILVAGVMGYLKITIDIGVAISASVILGIAVDDTIHFFSKYFKAKQNLGFEEAIDYVINHSANAMILTTLILSFTFLVFTASTFVPNINFAIVTITALNIALLLDLLLVPALLSIIDNKK